MSRLIEVARRMAGSLTRRSWRYWTGAVVGAVALVAGAVLLPLGAFAGDRPQSVTGSARTVTGATLTVTLRCPRATTAVGVTAQVAGSAGITINELTPQANLAVARAVRADGPAKAWSLSAKALCVRRTVDIEYVARTFTVSSAADSSTVACGRGKELIGLGWSVDPHARASLVTPLFTGGPGSPPGTGMPGTGVPGTGVPGTGMPGTGMPGTGMPGTGMPGTGMPGTGGSDGAFAFGVTMNSYRPAAAPGATWNQSVVAVCATPGHATVGRFAAVSGAGTIVRTSATCPADTHLNALGFGSPPAGPRGRLQRELMVDSADVTGSLTTVSLDDASDHAPRVGIAVLCTAS